ncbi:MAG: ABC transporter ATP-binding protein [Deltaproteobacteria bacterium]|nr:ABC transporter ATP-binding protein [Deltaproteobacteria bacterium]
MALLEIKNITKSFGGLMALSEVSFDLREGEILGLIGPNGAGKTTLFSVISGFCRPDKGRILFKGEDITSLATSQICKKGIGRTFQLVKPFEEMSVLDNVMIGCFNRTERRKEAEERAREILAFTGLAPREDFLGGELTLADRKRLELARALATGPEILMLDEVMTGLTPSESDEAQALVRKIRDSGLTIILIEHVMRATMSLSDRIVVLHHGQVIAQGRPEEVSEDQRVIEAYLGRQAYA